MREEAEQLSEILLRFAHDPNDAALWAEARELADRFTLDQLCAMAAPRASEVARLFDKILGRNMRRLDSSGTLRVAALGNKMPGWKEQRSVVGGRG
jgi:hypothetical protein